MKFSFSIRAPHISVAEWHTSSQHSDTIEEAAKNMSDFAVVSFENNVYLEYRLEKINE